MKISVRTINYYYLVIVIVYSGYALSLFRSDFGTLLLFLLSIAVFQINKLSVSKEFFYLLTVWSGYCFIMMALSSELFPGFYLRHVNYILSAYILINVFSRDIFSHYVDIIYKLAIISLFFFTWQIIDYESINSVFTIIDLAGYEDSISQYRETTRSIGIYTVHGHPLAIRRNAGFAWEPGPFSIFLAIALYIYISKSLNILKSKTFWVLLITLITTQSTTGLGIFLALIGYTYLVNVKWTFTKVVFTVAGSIIFAFLFFTVDFLYPKIEGLFLAGDAEVLIIRSEQFERISTISLRRFAALEVGYMEFLKNPILGYAGSSKLSYANEMDLNVNIVTGMATIFGMYGIIWVIIAGVMTFKSSQKIAKDLNNKSKLAFLLLLVGALFAFHAQTFVILYVFILYGLFQKKSNISEVYYMSEPSLPNLRKQL